DAATDETYQVVRRNKHFARILAAVRRLRKARCRFEFVIMTPNYHELAAMVRLADDCGIDGVFFKLLNPGGLDPHNVETLSFVAGLEEQVERALVEARRLGVHTNLSMIRSDLPTVLDRYAGRRRINLSKNSSLCVFPWVQLYVDYHGRVGHCCDL